MTTCLSSFANFFCSIDEIAQIFWHINGQDPVRLGVNGPGTYPSTFGPGEESTLTIPGSYEFDGATVTCYYSSPSTSQTLYSVPALLRVQGFRTIV